MNTSKYLVLSALLLVMTITPPLSASPEKIYLYDLRYTLDIDRDDPQQLNMCWDHCHTAATLQGIVNRSRPRLYFIFVDAMNQGKINADQYWLQKQQAKDGWLRNTQIIKIESFTQLLKTFACEINGAVIYDPKVPATSSIASAVAGAENLIAVRYDTAESSLYNKIIEKGPRITPSKIKPVIWLVNPDGSSKFTGSGNLPGSEYPSTGSAKCDAHLWLKNKYIQSGKLNCRYGAYYIDYYWHRKNKASILNHHQLTNHDFFVSNKAFFFDLSPWADEPATDDPQQEPGLDRFVMKRILHEAYKQTDGSEIIQIGGFPAWAYKYTRHAPGGSHHEVHTEWEYASIISTYNAFKDSDAIGLGAMANASFWQHMPLRQKYPQKWTTRQKLKQKGLLTHDGKVNFKNRQFFVFYVGDYDSSAWLYQSVPFMWDDHNRGKIPLMWAISPVLSTRAPMAMHYVWTTATENDYFVAADSGAGYLNPGMLQQGSWPGDPRPISNLKSGIDAWEKHCTKYYRQWGITVSGFNIEGFAPEMTSHGYEAYKAFSPNGVVVQKSPLTYLYDSMPVMRASVTLENHDPAASAEKIVQTVSQRPIPFHWFRTIMKSPTWHIKTYEHLKEIDPNIVLLDARDFFELYQVYLENHPDAAKGLVPMKKYWLGY